METQYKVVHFEPTKNKKYKIEIEDLESGEIEAFNVYEETVVNYRLIKGKELDKQAFEAFKKGIDDDYFYHYAINILSRRMYTEKEVKRKLSMKDATEAQVVRVVTKLKELELIDDFLYATLYIENANAAKKKSRRRIISDLRERGVSAEIIDDLAGLFDNEAEVRAVQTEIEKVYRRHARKEMSDWNRKRKIIESLMRKGFDHHLIEAQYGYFLEDLEEN